MSDQDDTTRRVIKVPGRTNGQHSPSTDPDDLLVAPADLGSASRSCLAIILILLVIALLLCVFILVQPFLN